MSEKDIEKSTEIFEEDLVDNDLPPIVEKKEMVGIETEEFDIQPEYENENINEEGIEIDYTFNGEEVKEGLKLFQKHTIYKRNMIYTVILLLIFSLYIVGLFKNPSNTLGIFLSVMCVAVISFLWYNPLAHVKKMAKATDENQQHFKMFIYPSCIKIGEQNGEFVIKYNKEITKVFETVKLFLICAGKERIFILPKRCLKDGQVNEVKEILKSAMNENYIKKI